jgi:hypothetical protein
MARVKTTIDERTSELDAAIARAQSLEVSADALTRIHGSW